jgi:ribosomal protein L11 methyltransferase
MRAASRRIGHPRIVLEAWFPGRSPTEPLRRRLQRALAAAAVPPTCRPRLRRMADGRWVEAWQKSLRPMRIGRRFLAVPESCAVPRSTGRIAIRIPFGQAFGTGEHASTRMALRLLESHLRAGDEVVDLGTGTGILAVAAHRLGAARVLAVDSDPIAVEVARDTLRRNDIGSGVLLRCDDAAAACRGGPFDLALVNIGSTVIGRILPDLSRALRPGGRAILSGILIEDEPVLEAAGRPLGLSPAARLRTRPWSALLLRARSRPRGRREA